MSYELIIRPEAESDVLETFLWYENKRKGLGHDFLLQIDAGICFINRNPTACPVKYKNARVFLIKRFPYKIIYLVQETTIIVLAIIHTKRNPKLSVKIINSN